MQQAFSFFVILLTFFFVSVPSVWAQRAQEKFGKNRIQYRQYKWQYISSEHFQLYYYDNDKKTATHIIQYLEQKFEYLVDLIGYAPYTKTTLFLYRSISDLQQSNIGLYDVAFDMGGETEFRQRYTQIAHTGSLDELKKHATYEVAELWINEAMFGRGLKSAFKNAILLSLPDWCISGLASYIAYGWNAEMDDYVRQLLYTKKVRRIDSFKGEEARLIGQSIWNYIAEKYGRSNIANLLNYIRIISSVRRSITVILGVSFRKFVDDWHQFYFKMGQHVQQHYIFPDDSMRITRKASPSITYTTVKISPDGTKIAYTENDRGRFIVKIKSLINRGVDITILRGGNRVFDQEVDYNIPLVDWVNSSQLGVIGVKKGSYFFWLYDLNTHSKVSRKLPQFNNIRSISFSDNGRLAALSANSDGYNDLFLMSTRRNRIKRLTRDAYDDIDATFLPDEQTIVFSSNRTTDTINTVVKDVGSIPNNYNLYLFDLDDPSRRVTKVTNAVGKNYLPYAYDQNTIYYLSDQRGIANLFKYNLVNGVYTQLTHFNSGIQRYDLNFVSNKFALIVRKKLRTDIFVLPQFGYVRQVFSPSTTRVTSQQIKSIRKRYNPQPAQTYHSIKELVDKRLQIIRQQHLPDGYNSDSLDVSAPLSEQLNEVQPSVEQPRKDTAVATKNYVFEDEIAKKDISSKQFLNRYMKAEKRQLIEGPFLYKHLFIYNSSMANLIIDPLFGYGLSIEMQMNDVLENYRFFGGLKFAFSTIESGEVFAEAQYLPHRIDYSARIERKALVWSGAINRQKYAWQKIELGASLPFSVRWRIALKPFLGYVNYVDQGVNTPPFPAPPVFKSDEEQLYAGTKIELIYDNSLTTGLNIIEGTRGKINFITYAGLDNEKANFSHLFADIRHYQRLYKQIVFAMRGYLGTFFGNSPKQYVLGGMDNWFLNTTHDKSIRSPLARLEGFNYNLIFTEFATGMRGFNYATLYGNNVLLANVELRVPLIRVLSTGPVSSKFLRNIQLIGFFDIGTSWQGSFSDFAVTSPMRVVPEKATGNPFRIEVVDELNPWIYSYGAGLRAKILGFYTKFDLAWPVQNYQQGEAQIYVTLGLDF